MNSLAIVGSRNYGREDLVRAYVRAVARRHPDALLVVGGCAGPETWAADEAERIGLSVHREPRQTGNGGEWRRVGAIIRRADAVVVFWDLASSGAVWKADRSKEAGKLFAVFGPAGERIDPWTVGDLVPF